MIRRSRFSAQARSSLTSFHRMPRAAPSILTGLLLAVIAAGCGGSDDAARAAGGSGIEVSCGAQPAVEGRPVRVVSTVAPITNIIANIVGGSGTEVVGIVPEGTNSHTFEPPPSAAEALERADIVFINGLVLEEPTKELAAANLQDGGEIC
jgi:ABC-type Zn uptake system ZnuABC Zn-binding protein ZnuA